MNELAEPIRGLRLLPPLIVTIREQPSRGHGQDWRQADAVRTGCLHRPHNRTNLFGVIDKHNEPDRMPTLRQWISGVHVERQRADAVTIHRVGPQFRVRADVAARAGVLRTSEIASVVEGVCHDRRRENPPRSNVKSASGPPTALPSVGGDASRRIRSQRLSLCLGSEGAPTASDSGCYVNSRGQARGDPSNASS